MAENYPDDVILNEWHIDVTPIILGGRALLFLMSGLNRNRGEATELWPNRSLAWQIPVLSDNVYEVIHNHATNDRRMAGAWGINGWSTR